MKILVTGGAGFIGSKVVELLIKQGHQVKIIDNLSTGHKSLINSKAEFINGDLRTAADSMVAVKGCDAVIHFAAQAIVPESIADPQKTFEINMIGGQNLLEAMRQHSVKKLVFSSSCATYGVPQRVPITETDRQIPISPYGASKLALEQLIRAYYASYGIGAAMLRYFNPYGPYEVHDPETHAIPNFITAILAGRPVPLYWGGKQERDFFYVYDLAQAHILALDLTGCEEINLGSGQGTKVIDVVKKLEAITGKTAKIDDLGERPGDPPALWADITKAKQLLGWQPSTDLDTGLRQTVSYFSSLSA